MSRKKLLENCLKNDVIPSSLNFRVPENGCFERALVQNFQLRFLRTELTETIKQLSPKEDNLKVKRAAFSSRLIETSESPRVFTQDSLCQSVISGSLTLRDTRIRDFGVKF